MRKTIVGVQFLFVAFGATVLVPLLVGLDPATPKDIKASIQFVFAISTADLDKERPIRIITGPITTGGNSLSNSFLPCHLIKADITK